jgi:hypothetical protein
MMISVRFACCPALTLAFVGWPGRPSAAAQTRCLGLHASIIGTSGDDRIPAGGGDDHIDARRGEDVVCAGAGAMKSWGWEPT